MLEKLWKVTVDSTLTYTPARVVSFEFLNATSSQPLRLQDSRVFAGTLNQLSSPPELEYLETKTVIVEPVALFTMMLPI